MTVSLEGCKTKTIGNYTCVLSDDKRISKAINKMGGALMLLKLPGDVKAVLKSTTDPKVKADMLEFCADNTWIIEGVTK